MNDFEDLSEGQDSWFVSLIVALLGLVLTLVRFFACTAAKLTRNAWEARWPLALAAVGAEGLFLQGHPVELGITLGCSALAGFGLRSHGFAAGVEKERSRQVARDAALDAATAGPSASREIAYVEPGAETVGRARSELSVDDLFGAPSSGPSSKRLRTRKKS